MSLENEVFGGQYWTNNGSSCEHAHGAVFRRRWTGVGRIALAMLGVLGASTQPSRADSSTIETVTVTASQLEEELPQQLSRYGTRVDTITAQQVQNNGYVDVGQALQAMVPGLYLSPKNGPFDYADISLLGSRTQDTLWLVDGVRINNRLYASTPPLDTLPAAMVDRIEVLEGGQSLFYGTQAIAGAINVVTRAFSDTPDGQVMLGADTNGGRHIDAYFRDSIGDNQFVLYGSSDQAKGFQPFRDQDFQPSSTVRKRGYDVITLGGKYGYNITKDLRLSLSYQHTNGDLDYARPYLIAVDTNHRQEDLATLKVDYDVTPDFGLYVKGYYHNWDTHYDMFYNDLTTPGKLDVINKNAFWGFKDYGVNVLAKYAPPDSWLEYYMGYDMQNYGGRDDVLVIKQQEEMTHAVFGQIRTSDDLVPGLRIAAGFRENIPSVGQSALVWNVSGQYDITDSLFVRGMVGTAFRLPSAEELFADDPNDERGDPNIRPEKSFVTNASIGGHLDLGFPIAWELIGYLRNVKDLIDYASFDSTTNQEVFGNLPGTVRMRGGMLTLDVPFSDWASANASYTYNEARDSGTNQQIARIPTQLLKFGVDYHPTDEIFGLSATLNFVGKTYGSVWDGLESYGNYAVVDVAGRVYLDPDKHNTIYMRIENVFDTQYATSLGTSYRDSDNSPYTYWNLGVPRTWEIRYGYKF